MKILRNVLPLLLGFFYAAVGIGVLARIYLTAGQLHSATDWLVAAFFFVAALCTIGGGVYYLRRVRGD
ncbi:MAG TPA: hypothetical protein VF613_15320 [Longimicrobium sp.]